MGCQNLSLLVVLINIQNRASDSNRLHCTLCSLLLFYPEQTPLLSWGSIPPCCPIRAALPLLSFLPDLSHLQSASSALSSRHATSRHTTGSILCFPFQAFHCRIWVCISLVARQHMSYDISSILWIVIARSRRPRVCIMNIQTRPHTTTLRMQRIRPIVCKMIFRSGVELKYYRRRKRDGHEKRMRTASAPSSSIE